MILVQAKQVARHFAGQVLYQDVNFNIQTGDRIALIGRNGTGKSTLIKQLIQAEPLSQGQISYARDIKIGYLEQHVDLQSSRTIWEEMLSVFDQTLALRDQGARAAQAVADLADQAGSPAYTQALARYDTIQDQLNQANAYGIESEIRTVLHGFGFYEADYQRPVADLSGGQQTRLALARTLLVDHDLLILDEPTNHLDMATLSWLETYLKNYRAALVIVSHDRYFLNRVTNQVIELRGQTSHLYRGNYDDYLKEKEARLEAEWRAYTKQQKEVEKLQDFIQKNIVRASTSKRAQSRRKQLEKMDRIEKPVLDDKSPRFQFSAEKPSGNRVLQAHDLTIGYPGSQGRVAKGINLDLRRQEAIAIVGPNGVGKSTLLKTLIGQLPALAGDIQVGAQVQLGYYDQTLSQLDPKLTVLETLWRAHDRSEEWKVRSILGSFLFTGEDVDKTVGMLSGGEKARLNLALLATDHDNTLLLDEPTNHLDIDSKEVLEEALIHFDGTLLFVSHDRYFINRIASQVLEISPQGSTLYLGDYDYYLAKKEELDLIRAGQNPSQDPAVKESPQVSQGQQDYEENKRLKSQVRQLKDQAQHFEDQVSQLDQEVARIHDHLVQASQDNDPDRLAQLHQELLDLEGKQDQALEAWEAASLDLEAFIHQHPDMAAYI